MGVGDVCWTFTSQSGEHVTIPLQCYYVPDLPFRLLPPQQLGHNAFSVSVINGAWIGGGKSAKVIYEGHVIDFPYCRVSGLPVFKTILGIERLKAFAATPEIL